MMVLILLMCLTVHAFIQQRVKIFKTKPSIKKELDSLVKDS